MSQISLDIRSDGVVLPGLSSAACLGSSFRFVEIGSVIHIRDIWSSAHRISWTLLPYLLEICLVSLFYFLFSYILVLRDDRDTPLFGLVWRFF